jgi:2-dehydropantoate 2-reductase
MMNLHTDIAVVGAGAMGALFGSILAENGLDVALIDINEEHVDAMRSEGLKIEGYGGDRTLRMAATSNPNELESANLLLFQCKGYGTRDAARSVKHLLHDKSVCISFQNGLGNEEVIGEEVGIEYVLGGVTPMGAMLLGPGRVRDFSRVPSFIGELHGGPSDRVSAIAEKFTGAGLETHASENIRSDIWKKLLGNISQSAISGLTNLTAAALNRVPELRLLSLEAMEEAFAVAEACGVGLDREEVLKGMETISTPGGTGDNKSSLCVDLLNQRPTEVDFIYGSVIDLGEERGLHTPTLKGLHHLVKGVEARMQGEVG